LGSIPIHVARDVHGGGNCGDPLRERLKKRGIDLIVPYRKNSKKRKYEDGRKLRRYKRRWIIERTNAWLSQFDPDRFHHAAIVQ
jgi:IS5 family transposase